MLSPGTVKTDSFARRIKNPLLGIPYEQLMHDVEVFAQEKGLTEHIPLLRKGALVAQEPSNYENITGPEQLTEDEKIALQNEVEHKWRMPMKLYLTIAICSIGAAVQGWDQTGVNGANIFFPDVYGIGGDSVRETILVGLVNAGPYIGSASVPPPPPLPFYIYIYICFSRAERMIFH